MVSNASERENIRWNWRARAFLVIGIISLLLADVLPVALAGLTVAAIGYLGCTSRVK